MAILGALWDGFCAVLMLAGLLLDLAACAAAMLNGLARMAMGVVDAADRLLSRQRRAPGSSAEALLRWRTGLPQRCFGPRS